MNRPNDPDDRLRDTELQQFEDQLRNLRPSAPRFALAKAGLVLSSPGGLAKKTFGGWMVNPWAAAAALLLMWSIGAGMGAAVALAWGGALGEFTENANIATSLPREPKEPTEHLDSTVSNAEADHARETIPDLSPAASPSRPAEHPFPRFAMYSNIHRESQPAVQGPLSPIHVYRAASVQADSVASPSQLLTDVPYPVALSNAVNPNRSGPAGMVDYQPMHEKNQRELLRGLLGTEATRVF